MTNPKCRTVKTRILLLSDTHAALPVDNGADDGNSSSSSSSSSSKTTFRTPFHAPLPSADVLIHTGDLTMTGSLDEHERALELILSVDAPLKIVIPGNHDLTLDREYYARHHSLHARYARYDDATLDRIQELYSGADARHAGVRYLVEGRESFRLQNGARLNVYASAWQPEFFDWAFGYPRTCDRFNLDLGPDHASPTAAAAAAVPENPVPDFVGGELGRDDDDTSEREGGKGDGNVDIVLTHGPPMGILDRVARTDESVGCVHLRRAVGRCRPRLHCFGHIHEAWGAVRKRWNDEVVGGRDDTGTNTTPGAGYGGMEQGGASTQGDNLRESNGQFDPVHNPTTVYDESGSGSGSDASVITGESLVKPGSYATQMDRMAAYVDATDLEHGKETVFVNASIMNLRYRAVNAPWLVDLELPVVE
ncbi:hypothetical protein PV08_06687 [Exophiala spinifera]|uniref:Calcineurin-like phosphoesterase domain-containing protein n=1 Tax=Exophiala spinifera TaxID=91928 RepID=A0A0D1YFT7_9EURO|nr:uncharacterized protein PV08_06687 [Exophiala spinifera]KIW13906.1 hypothetical protein PV08_06687 [Exophiala spinifera]